MLKFGMSKTHVIIPAAGSSSRMGQEIPKQFVSFHGKTLIEWVDFIFSNVNAVDTISIGFNNSERKYIENSKLQIKETKSVATLLGRKRAVWDSDSQNKIRRDAAERMAINMPIQGTAAEMIKLAMIKIHRQMNKENLKSKLVMQIHDELLLEVHQDEIDYISKMVIENMRDAMKLDVPIEIDFGVGPSWYEAH